MTDEIPLWIPSRERIDASNMTAFMRYVAANYPVEIDGYESLWHWSVDHRDLF